MSASYTVRSGDTLSSIARRKACSLEALQAENPSVDPRRMKVGAVLSIPDLRDKSAPDRPIDPTANPKKAKPVSTPEDSHGSRLRDIWEQLEGETGEIRTRAVRLWHDLSEPVLQWLREHESAELKHDEDKKKTQPRADDENSQPRKPQDKSAPAKERNAACKHRDEVLKQLHDRLYATPHVVQTSGVTLTRNERKMIVAAVGLCEVNSDVFGSGAADPEFVGRKFGKKGSEQSYSRIVHVGLSYGYIQFTQDSGNLGKLLQRMQSKVERRDLLYYFPNVAQLIQMTTDGLPSPCDRFGKSALAYWGKLSAAEREALQKRANTDKDKDDKPDNPLKPDEELRGARVQKIPYYEGYPSIDLWEDYSEKPKEPSAHYSGWASAFKAAGDLPAFQDAQLELAVEDFFNPVLKHCQDWNIRSGTGLAMVLAGAVRGGPGAKAPLVTLLSRVAKEKFGLEGRFETRQQELDSVKSIATASVSTVERNGKKAKICQVGSVVFPEEERTRAGRLLKNEFQFLNEDLYDTRTYDFSHDK